MICSREIATQTLNVFITMVGAGIVSLPLVLRATTLYIGCATLLLAAIACCSSMYLFTWLARRHLITDNKSSKAPLLNIETSYDIDLLEESSPQISSTNTTTINPDQALSSYDEVVNTYLPPWGSLLAQTTIIALLFFVLALFVDIAHDSITATFPITSFANGLPLRASICVVMCIFSMPVTLESLKYTSMFGFLSLFYLLVIIIYRSVQHVQEPGWKLPSNVPDATRTGVSFGVTTQLGAFSAIFNSVAAQAELPLEYQKRGLGSIIPIAASCTAFVFYFLFALGGYLALDGAPPHDILTGFSTSDELMSGARIAIFLVSMFKAPLVANPLKGIIRHRCTFLPESHLKWTCLVTPILFLLAFSISSLMTDSSTVFGYVSAFGVNVTMFVIPGLCLRTAGIQTKDSCLRFFGWLLAFFGVFAVVVGLYATIEYNPDATQISLSPSSS